MKGMLCLTILALCLGCGSASANWREDNPNQPNGYAASMYRYHHGTPDDDGPHDGHRASSIRNRNGLDRFAPPDDSNDRWGSHSDNGGSRWGDSGGGGLGRHFRQGQQESQAFWQQRMQGQMQSRGYGPQNAALGPGYNNPPGYAGNMPVQAQGYGTGGYGAGSYVSGGAQYGAVPYAASEMPHFNGNYNQINSVPVNYQYAPAGFSNTTYRNSTALQHAVSQRPMGTLLRNSQSGFNRIYSP